MRNKSTNIILSIQERNLIANSTICDNDLELKQILMSYDKSILKNDLDHIKFKNERVFKNLISHEYREAIINRSSLEWRHDRPLGLKKNPCELCGCTQSEQKYLIVNDINKNKLEVGSSCITKFPSIDSRYKGESIKNYEKWSKYSPDKIDRLGIFNDLFGGGRDIYKDWELKYNSYDIEFPNDFDKEFALLMKNSRKYYRDFINGNIDESEVIKFKNCIQDSEYFFDKVSKFYNDNRNNKYICTKEIGDLYKRLNYNNSLIIIKDLKCQIPKEFSKYITNKEFISRFTTEIENCFEEVDLKFRYINDNEIVFSYQYNNFEDILLRISLTHFSELCYEIFYGDDLKNFSKVIKTIALLNDRNNINEFLGIIQFIIKGTGYYFEYDKSKNDNHNILVKKRGVKKSALMKVSDLLYRYPQILYLDKNESKNFIIDEIKELKWTTFEEQDKYDVGNIAELFAKGN